MPALRPFVLGFIVFIAACERNPTKVLFDVEHAYVFDGRKQTCWVRILSNTPRFDPNVETMLEFSCRSWKSPVAYKFNSCEVKQIEEVRWQDNENAVLVRVKSSPDYAAVVESSFRWNFENRTLESNLYGWRGVVKQ